MSLSGIAVKKPITVLMAVVGVFFIGYLALNGLSIDLFPNIDFPVAFIQAIYPGVNPTEMENLVTKPVEDEIATVGNIKQITSYSLEGFSQIIVEFNWGENIDFGAIDLREKTDTARRKLPADVEQVTVSKFDINSMPIISLSISSDDIDLITLRSLIDDEIKPVIERIKGVATADVSGGLEREIHINVNLKELERYEISMNDVISSISSGNRNIPAGDMEEGQFKYLIRAEGQIASIDELKNLTIKKKGEAIITIKDVAEVNDTFKDISSESRINNNSSVTISIKKETGENPVGVSDGLKKVIKTLEIKYPYLEFTIGQDSSDFIKDSINMVTTNAMTGGLLAIIVLFLFLKNARSTVIIAVTIPVSIIATFSLLYLKEGITLNLMTLGGLALGIGMLLDNSIVVLENIYRLFRKKTDKTAVENSVFGADQVVMPVLTSTLTTLAVFLPLGFVPGMVGEIFFNLALSIIFALISSFFVAFTVIPSLTAKFLKIKENTTDEGPVLRKIKGFYEKNLNRIISKKRNTWMYFGAILVIFAITLTMFPPTEFFPKMDRGEFSIKCELIEGTKLEEVDKVVKRIEKRLFSYVGTKENPGIIEKIVTDISLGSATIKVKMVTVDKRDITTDEFIEKLRNETKNISNLKQMTFSTQGMGPGGSGKPIKIEITGDNFDIIENICLDITDKIKNINGLKDIDSGVSQGRPEVKIEINREKVRDLGISFAEVANELRTYIYGSIASTFKENDKEYDIRVKLDDDMTDDLEKIRNMRMLLKGKTIILSDIAAINLDYGYTTIIRKDKKRTLSIEADLFGRPMGAIVADLIPILESYELPEGYFYKFGGEEADRKDAFGDLGLALIAAIFLVYMIMASQFESLLEPFVIMFTIPLSIIGVVMFLNLFNLSFSVTAIIGIIMLAGIVVNNGILLIEYINQRRRERGLSRHDAIMEAGLVRIRPILMTTMTTMLGMVPLALGIGAGSDFFQPLAVTVIGGLMFATVLTLTFIPVTFIIIEDFREWFFSLFNKEKV
ncbi:MAG: efflux RND transporter permease subunit [Candidatus Muirbacterium halophilum]|nr:efflux RND transporter permease subunit [Candidatus Muirbacterium halophilum]MCK9475017.1 efflux RND transporter permease subunit [Candidatus Muirbacterium halophilum]